MEDENIFGLRSINIYNTTGGEITVEITVSTDDSVVYDRVHSVPRGYGETAGSTEITDESLREPADYVVSATDRTHGHSTDTPSVSEFFGTGGEMECIDVTLVIDERRVSAGFSEDVACDSE